VGDGRLADQVALILGIENRLDVLQVRAIIGPLPLPRGSVDG